jgi:hypothetical protein
MLIKSLRLFCPVLLTALATTSVHAGGRNECMPVEAPKIYVIHKRAPKEKWCKLPPVGVLLQTIPVVLLPETGARVDPRRMEAAFIGCEREDMAREIAKALKERQKEAQTESEEAKQAKIERLKSQLGELSEAIKTLQAQLDGIEQ